MKRFILFFSATWVCWLEGCAQSEFDLPQSQEVFHAEVSYNNKVDILFVIDNSSTMLRFQDRLVMEAKPFLDQLDAFDLDYRLASVSTDVRPRGSGGRLLGDPVFLTRTTPNLLQNFVSKIRLGEVGSDIESGLESLYRALQRPEGQSFLRPDALLVVIVLTNEDDYSPQGPQFYGDFLDRIRPPVAGFQQGWVLNLLGVLDVSGRCPTAPGFNEAALRYMELANRSGGIQSSICESSLKDGVANIQKRIVEIISEYRLQDEPKLDSLRVFVNGVLVPQDPNNGWSYLPQRRVIRFHGSFLPKPTDTIRVDYKPAGGS